MTATWGLPIEGGFEAGAAEHVTAQPPGHFHGIRREAPPSSPTAERYADGVPAKPARPGRTALP